MSDGFKEQSEKLELVEALSKRVFDMFFKVSVCFDLTDLDIKENDLTTLTAKEIVDKIRAVLTQNPSDANLMSFTHYLAKYPLSMCKRDVSPLLKKLIGFHYRLGVPNQEQKINGAEKVSFEDLSEIFGRSKATISECVNETESEWKEIKRQAVEEERMQEEAKRQFIEEEKQKLRAEKQNNQTEPQTNERTP